MDCINAELLAKSSYVFICIFKCVVCIIGILITAYTIKCNAVARLINPNAKVLCMNHLIWVAVTSIAYLVVYVYELIRLFKHVESKCDYLIPRGQAFMIRFPAATACFCHATTMFACALERSISTAFPNYYEKKRKPTLGIVLMIISSIYGILASYLLLWLPNTFVGEDIATTAMTPDNAYYQKIWFWHLIGIEMLTVIAVASCFAIARMQMRTYEDRKSPRLSTKYQTRENLRIVKLLLPCFTMNIIFNLFPVILFSISEIMIQYEIVDRVLTVEYLNQIVLYSILMPLFMLIMHKKKRQQINPRDLKPGGNDYFNQLRDQWSKTNT